MSEPQTKFVQLKATVRQIYDGKFLMAGDRFPKAVPEDVADSLIARHYAAPVDEPKVARPEPSARPEPVMQRKDLTADDTLQEPVSAAAESESESSDSEESKTPRKTPRRYNRRDLVADEE